MITLFLPPRRFLKVLALTLLVSMSIQAETVETSPPTETPTTATPPATSNTQNSSTTNSADFSVNGPANMQMIKDLCPPPEKLILDPIKQTWSAPRGWKTTQPSFLHSIDTFVGAQWVGISVGAVICIYTKAGRNTFPVTLQRGLLVSQPNTGGLWSPDKGGYMECKTQDVNNCPFFVQIPKPVKNVYDELDFYKGKPVQSE